MLQLVFADCGQRLLREQLLRVAQLLQLEYELIHVLHALANIAFSLLRGQLELVELLLQLGNCIVLTLDLILLYNEQTLPALVLFLQCDDLVTAALVLLKHFSKIFIGLLSILLNFSLNQG